MKLPKIDQRYNCFNNGVIHISKIYYTTITEIIPFKDFDKNLPIFDIWIEKIKNYCYSFKHETDYFIRAVDENGNDEIFVRSIDDGWWSVLGGKLDLDGSLLKQIEQEVIDTERKFIKFISDNRNCINKK